MKNIEIFLKVLLSCALIYFASVLLLFTFELAKTRTEVDKLTVSIESLDKNKTIQEITKSMPIILKEIDDVKKLIPSVVKEVNGINENIPKLIDESSKIRETIPSIIKESQAIRQTVPSILEESKAIRKTLPSVLYESKMIRKEAPALLNQTQKITKNIESISKKAGSNAAQGAIKGIITLPSDFIKGTINKVDKTLGTDEK